MGGLSMRLGSPEPFAIGIQLRVFATYRQPLTISNVAFRASRVS
jgi:hypothetical protein